VDIENPPDWYLANVKSQKTQTLKNWFI
jgi:hypothetical protein